MKFHRKIKSVLIVVVLLPLAHFLFFPKASRCLAAHFYGPFDRIEFGLLVSYDTPPKTRDSLLHIYQKAIDRNLKFWKKLKGNPKIIYCHNQQLYNKYANPNRPATVFEKPYKVYLVLSNATLDIDILSHEICHTQLYAHLGWWKKKWQIPSWFDEGLAMQLDHRKAYSEAAYIDLLDRLDYYPNIKTYTSSKQFYKGTQIDVETNFILARHEVFHWLKQKSIVEICKKIKDGQSFQEVYNQ